MMRKNKTKMLILILLVVILTGCSLDLSHKHYLDNYGVCNSCKENLCIELQRNANLEYVSNNVATKANEYVYFCFQGNGEDSIMIEVELSGSIQEVRLYSKDSTSYFLTPKQGNKYLYESEIIANKTYYFKVRTMSADNIKIKIYEPSNI